MQETNAPIPEKESVKMTTYQSWKTAGLKEGLEKGLEKKARLTVLRGRWNNVSAEILADQAELPLGEVNNMIKGYDNALKFWLKDKGKTTGVLPKIEYLSEQEVGYLMTFFSQKHAVSEG